MAGLESAAFLLAALTVVGLTATLLGDRVPRWAAFLALCTVSWSSDLHAQDHASLQGGLGVATDGVALSLSLIVETDDLPAAARSISLRASRSEEILGGDIGWDVGLLVGPSVSWGSGPARWHATAGAGIAVTGYRYDEWDLDLDFSRAAPGEASVSSTAERATLDRTGIGLPLASSVSWQPLSFLGLGLSAFANVNTIHSFGGAVVHLKIGGPGS